MISSSLTLLITAATSLLPCHRPPLIPTLVLLIAHIPNRSPPVFRNRHNVEGWGMHREERRDVSDGEIYRFGVDAMLE
jgi:hypothetical protein